MLLSERCWLNMRSFGLLILVATLLLDVQDHLLPAWIASLLGAFGCLHQFLQPGSSLLLGCVSCPSSSPDMPPHPASLAPPAQPCSSSHPASPASSRSCIRLSSPASPLEVVSPAASSSRAVVGHPPFKSVLKCTHSHAASVARPACSPSCSDSSCH